MLTREVPIQPTTTLFSFKILLFYFNWLHKIQGETLANFTLLVGKNNFKTNIVDCRTVSGICSLTTLNTPESQQGMPLCVVVINFSKFG